MHKKILILSAPIGSGHKLAAEALASAFAEKNYTVVMASAFDFFPSWIGNTFLQAYIKVLQICPALYALVYKWGNNQEGSLWLRNILNRGLAMLARNFVNKVDPVLVIATHATPAGIIAMLKKVDKKNLFLVGVVTDYTVHNWWLYNEINLYITAYEDVQPSKLLLEQKVLPLGIPLRPEFYQGNEKNKSEKKNCLLMGGGDGLLPMAEIILSWKEKFGTELNFIAITGRNKKLAEQLKKIDYINLTILKFIDNISSVMLKADVLVSKSGGVSSAEAIALKIPYIIYSPLAGQETVNSNYLSRAEVAVVAHDKAELLVALDTLLYNQKHLTKLKDNLNKLAKPNATQNIVEAILKLHKV